MNSKAEVKSDPRRALPSVESLLAQMRSQWPDLTHWAAAAGARSVLAEERERLASGGPAAGAPMAARFEIAQNSASGRHPKPTQEES